MGGDDHGSARAQSIEGVKHRRLALPIQIGGWFVQQDQRRVPHHRTREAEAPRAAAFAAALARLRASGFGGAGAEGASRDDDAEARALRDPLPEPASELCCST